ncbi:MAG: trigger factor [Candidatus Dojkabacteria bacterium]
MGMLAKKPTEDSSDAVKAAGGSVDKPYTFEVKDLKDSRKELVIKVEPKFFEGKLEQAYTKLAPEVKVPGFRPGKAPRNLVEAKLGARLYEEAINITIPQITAIAMTESKLDPLDYAQYKVTKVSKDEGLEYSAAFTVLPTVKLPDFKKLKTKKEEVKIEEKEIEDSLKRLTDATLERLNKAAEEDGDEPSESKSKSKPKKKYTKKDIDWAKELDDKELKTEEDVRKRLQEVITEQKEQKVEDSFVDQLVSDAIELAKIKPPSQIVESESKRAEQSYIKRIEDIGLKLEDFLKTQNTTLEELRKSWEKDAEFKIAADLLFIQIAKDEQIQVKKEEIDAEIERIQDPETKNTYENEQGRNYIHSVILRRKSVEKLMELAGHKKKVAEKKEPTYKKKASGKNEKQG